MQPARGLVVTGPPKKEYPCPPDTLEAGTPTEVVVLNIQGM